MSTSNTLAFFALIVIVAAAIGSHFGRNAEPPKPLTDRITELCHREFRTEESRMDCRTRLTIRAALDKDKRDRDADLDRFESLYRQVR